MALVFGFYPFGSASLLSRGPLWLTIAALLAARWPKRDGVALHLPQAILQSMIMRRVARSAEWPKWDKAAPPLPQATPHWWHCLRSLQLQDADLARLAVTPAAHKYMLTMKKFQQ